MTFHRFALAFLFSMTAAFGAQINQDLPMPGDKMLAEYFRAETARLQDRCLAGIDSIDDWKARRSKYREQLLDMLGLSPMPEKTDLQPVITGRLDEKEFTVEKLYFQSSPHLYVTANLYLPKNQSHPAPAVLYVCGHSQVISNGVSYGNKTGYQHHGAWFARNGFVCLIVDTVQWGEILGHHWGTYKENQWWWNSRGFTPAAVEAWNNIRALDYLESRPEVDKTRIGMTGRSGGGAYSWVLTAIDDRIKCAAPVAGITDLQNYVVDGAVEGHCDCMFFVNTYRWDYPLLAAMAAPRPLMLGNSDKDKIFPLDGIERLHSKVKKVYDLHNATTNLALLITEGPHEDTQDLQVPVFRWFNRKLKGEDPVIDEPATNFFKPEQLKVFTKIPEDQINTTIAEHFVPKGSTNIPQTADQWSTMRNEWTNALRTKVFAGWPDAPQTNHRTAVFKADRDGLRLSAYDFTSQSNVVLRFYVVESAKVKRPHNVSVEVVDQQKWQSSISALASKFSTELVEELKICGLETRSDEFDHLRSSLEANQEALVLFAPRGVGLSSWSGNERKQIHIRRRFMLLGQTLDGMRVWDIMRCLQIVRLNRETSFPIQLRGAGDMGVNALFASLFEPNVRSLELTDLPPDLEHGPDYLNVLRVLDLPSTVGLAADRLPVTIIGQDSGRWESLSRLTTAVNLPSDRIKIIHAARK